MERSLLGRTRVRVVLADDHSMVREALARILDESGRIEVVGQASDGAEVLEVAAATNPQVVILDYSMPSGGAPQIIDQLLRLRRDIKILVLTVHENIHYAVRVLEAGGHGYLIKSAAVDELVKAILAVYDGGIYVFPGVADEVLHHLRRPKRQRVGLEALSEREFAFLRILGAGKTLQQCADEMNISTSTASTYRARIMEKLNLASTSELIRFALENGIVG